MGGEYAHCSRRLFNQRFPENLISLIKRKGWDIDMKKSIVSLHTLALSCALAAVFLTFGTASAAPRFVALTQKYEGHNVVEIVGLADDAENPGVDAFNAAVRSTVGKFYDDFVNRGAEDGEWVEITSYPMDGKKYTQVVTRYVEYPNYGSDGNITSAVYDKGKKNLITLADVLRQHGLDDKKLTEKAKKFYENFRERNERVTEAHAAALYIWESSDSDASDTVIILRVTIDDPDASEWTYFYSYSPAAEAQNWAHGLFEPMRPRALFSRYSVAPMNPPLRAGQLEF
jgi:hypothetical protein